MWIRIQNTAHCSISKEKIYVLQSHHSFKLARIFAMPANVEDLAALVSRLERVAVRLEGAAAGSGTGATAESSSAAVAAFDALLSGPLQQFVSISQQIGAVP
jgi:hypothetical protein